MFIRSVVGKRKSMWFAIDYNESLTPIVYKFG